MKRPNCEAGIALLFTMLTIVGLLAFMFITCQTIASRTMSMRQLYLSFQAAQSGYTNPLTGQDAANSAFWVLYLGGVNNLSKLTYSSNSTTTDSVDFDGDGNDDSTVTFDFQRSAGSATQVVMTIDRTSNLLSGALGILSNTRLKTKGRAFGSGTFINLQVDSTPYTYRRNCYEKLLEAYGVPAINCVNGTGGGLVDLADRAKLPGYLTGKLLYEPDPADPTKVIQNCADPYHSTYATEYNDYFGMDAINMYLTNMPGIDGSKQTPTSPAARPDPAIFSDSVSKSKSARKDVWAEEDTPKARPAEEIFSAILSAPMVTAAPKASPIPTATVAPAPAYNGFCRNPWSKTNPGDDCCNTSLPSGDGSDTCTTSNVLVGYSCPSQSMELIRRSDYFQQYKKGIMALAQAISLTENHFRWAVVAGPTSGGAIAEDPDGPDTKVYGEFEIFDGYNALRETVDPASMNLVQITGVGSGGAGAPSCSTFTINNPASIHLGADRLSDWSGRVSPTDFPVLSVVNHANRSAGQRYLAPLPDAYGTGFEYMRSGPTGFVGDKHPVFVGFNDFGYTLGSTSGFFSSWRTAVSDPKGIWPTQTWPPAYNVDPDGIVVEGSEYANSNVNQYAFNLFAAMQGLKGGLDLRGAFKHALDECNAKKAAFGAKLNCLTVTLAFDGPRLDDTGLTPACTTPEPVSFNDHKAAINSYLNAASGGLDSLDNVATVFVLFSAGAWSDPPPPADQAKAFMRARFNHDNYEKRFLVDLIVNLTDPLWPRFYRLLESLMLISRDQPEVTTS